MRPAKFRHETAGIQMVTGGYRCLREVTGGYGWLREVTQGYRRLRRLRMVTGGYGRLRLSMSSYGAGTAGIYRYFKLESEYLNGAGTVGI